jgi:AraC-like DNA-binding protein
MGYPGLKINKRFFMTRFIAQDINPHILTCGFLNCANHPLDNSAFPPRKVKWYELELILSGEGHIITDGIRIPTVNGAIFFRKPGMFVQGILPYSSYLVIFDMVHDRLKYADYSDHQCFDLTSEKHIPDSFENSDADIIDFNFPDMSVTRQFDTMKEFFSSLYEGFVSTDDDSGFYIKTILMQILMLYHMELFSHSRHVSRSRSHNINMKKVMKAKAIIDSNVSARFKLSELAEVAGLSPNFFCRIYKEIIGETPINYINKCRINMAKRMLLETDLPIKQIAYECGYENETYFFTLFKKLTGISPMEYRAKNSALFFCKNI